LVFVIFVSQFRGFSQHIFFQPLQFTTNRHCEPQRSNPVGAIINRPPALIDMFAYGLLRRKLLAMTEQ